MRAFKLFGGAVLASFVLLGCGGGGGGGSANVAPAEFVGTWAGTWDSPGLSSGTAQVTIAPNGAVTGSSHDTDADADAVVSGTVRSNSTFTGKAIYPEGTINLTGSWSIGGTGHLIGNLTQSANGQTAPLTFDLVKQ